MRKPDWPFWWENVFSIFTWKKVDWLVWSARGSEEGKVNLWSTNVHLHKKAKLDLGSLKTFLKEIEDD